MKALPLVWTFPGKFKEHVVIPGPFHTEMNFIGILTNHKMQGSGCAEIIEEVQLVTKGCIKNVFNEEASSKALFSLKVVKKSSWTPPVGGVLRRTKWESCFTELYREVFRIENRIRNGHLGKTAKFWLPLIDQFKLILMLIYAVKSHNRKLFHYCNGEMAVFFFAFDGYNYSCYLTWFEAFFTNLELTHLGAMEFIDNGALGFACSLIPHLLCAVHKTIEETFLKFA